MKNLFLGLAALALSLRCTSQTIYQSDTLNEKTGTRYEISWTETPGGPYNAVISVKVTADPNFVNYWIDGSGFGYDRNRHVVIFSRDGLVYCGMASECDIIDWPMSKYYVMSKNQIFVVTK